MSDFPGIGDIVTQLVTDIPPPNIRHLSNSLVATAPPPTIRDVVTPSTSATVMTSQVPQLYAQGHTPQSVASLSDPNVLSHITDLSNELQRALNAGSAEGDVPVENIQGALETVTRCAASLPGCLLPSALLALDWQARYTAEVNYRRHIMVEFARTMGPVRDVPHLAPLSTELGPPRNFDDGALIKRTRIGIMIELTTIPIYLYPLFSVRPGIADGDAVRSLLKRIVKQEMYHLALSGNLLASLGGSINLYDPRIVPLFGNPFSLLFTRIPIHLEPLSASSLGRFMEIEAPVDTRHPSRAFDNRDVLASQFSSIGQLYEDMLLILRGLDDQRFKQKPNSQFQANDFGSAFAITDQSTALQALRRITEEGEGNLRLKDSHYEVFSQLYSGGKTWETYPVPTDPQTHDYVRDSYIYRLSLAFDAIYCYLLLIIELVWQTDKKDIHSRLITIIKGLMGQALTPLAEILVQQKFGNGCAAPCFNYYPTCRSIALRPLAPIKLHQAILAELSLALAAAADKNAIGPHATAAAYRVDVTVQAAAKAAQVAAPNSADARAAQTKSAEAQGIARQLANAASAGDIASYADKLRVAALQVADLTQATAKTAQTAGNIDGMLAATYAVFDARVAVEDARRLVDRVKMDRVTIRDLIKAIKELYPPL